MKYFSILIIVIILFVGCTSAQNLSEKTVSNDVQTTLDLKKLSIESDWAYPMASTGMNAIANSGLIQPGSSVNQINLIGNTNYFKIEGDSISVYLPYFGERQMGGHYSSDAAIQFEGVPDNFEIKENSNKERHMLRLDFRNKTESYRAMITLYKNNKSEIIVTSSHRNRIRYSGNVSELPKEIQ